MTDRRFVLSSAALGLAASAVAAGRAAAQQAGQPAPAAKPLAGRVALVTGAARGIGRATAEELARQGADVALLDIADPGAIPEIEGYRLASRAELQEATAAVRATGVRALALVADVRDRAAMRQAAEQAARTLGGLDIVVANAGIGISGKFADFPPERWQAVIDVNLTGVANTVWAALPALRGRGGGRVVIVSSVQARMGSDGSTAYVASKWGVTGLMKTLALELGPESIAVNAVAPTAVETPLMRRGGRPRDEGTPQEQAERMNHALPVGTLLPQDIAEAIAFLCGPGARHISGVTLDVNAGRSARLSA